MRRESAFFFLGLGIDIILGFLGIARIEMPGWMLGTGVTIGTLIMIYGAYSYFSISSKEKIKRENYEEPPLKNTDTKSKTKTLNRVLASVEYDDERVYVLIKNKECKIDIICSEVVIYEVIPIQESGMPIFHPTALNTFNNINALVGSMARTVLSQSIGIDNTSILIEHRNKAEINLLTIESSKDQLEFKPPNNGRDSLVKGYYGIQFGFTVYPQKEGYENFDIYITAKIHYHGGSNLELWELRNARTKD